MAQTAEKSKLWSVFFIFIGCLAGIAAIALLLTPEADAAQALALFAFSISLAATGSLLLLYGRTPQRRKKLFFLYMTFFLVLAIIETGLHLLVLVAKPPALVAHKGTYEYLIDNPIFKNRPDAEDFLKEWSDTKMIFKPFVVWDREPFAGKYFNISKDGVRETWNPAFGEAEPELMYTFGGSTMWGSGVSDDQTIASYLSKALNSDRARYEVVNYGDVGYSFTQEVIQLLLLLREGHRPDYAVFYDGVNDIYAGYQAGKAELIINADMLSEKLEMAEPTAAQTLWTGAKKTINEHFLLYKSFRLLIAKFQKPFSEEGAKLSDQEVQRLAQAIGNSYAKTYALLESLAGTYHFQFICFWQPSGYLEKTLFAEEYNSHPRFKDETLTMLSRKTTEIVLANPPARLVDITDVLKDRKRIFYFDTMHLCAEGNQTVALRMADVLQRELLNEEYSSK